MAYWASKESAGKDVKKGGVEHLQCARVLSFAGTESFTFLGVQGKVTYRTGN